MGTLIAIERQRDIETGRDAILPDWFCDAAARGDGSVLRGLRKTADCPRPRSPNGPRSPRAITATWSEAKRFRRSRCWTASPLPSTSILDGCGAWSATGWLTPSLVTRPPSAGRSRRGSPGRHRCGPVAGPDREIAEALAGSAVARVGGEERIKCGQDAVLVDVFGIELRQAASRRRPPRDRGGSAPDPGRRSRSRRCRDGRSRSGSRSSGA